MADVVSNTKKGFSTTDVAGQLIGTFIQIGFAQNDAKKQRQLQEKIAQMSLENQLQIQKKLAEAQTDIERQRIAFQILALEKNEALVEKLEKDKNKSLIFLGVGVILLTIVVVLVKRKK
jgi:hypothetical protein